MERGRHDYDPVQFGDMGPESLQMGCYHRGHPQHVDLIRRARYAEPHRLDHQRLLLPDHRTRVAADPKHPAQFWGDRSESMAFGHTADCRRSSPDSHRAGTYFWHIAPTAYMTF